MRTTNLAIKQTVTASDISQVLSLRRTYEAQKRRLEIAETALNELERAIIQRIQNGATVICAFEVAVKSIERRNVAWKSVTAELIGHDATEAILASTTPTISYRLLINKGE
ncbi:MAG: hypothetical protein AB7N80_01110 [Bdellovibrionales bacterium]